MIYERQLEDIDGIYFVINKVAKAYQSATSADCYPRSYMPLEKLGEAKRGIQELELG